ncbi:hemagglutinin, partial [Mycoplasmopsis synoviae]
NRVITYHHVSTARHLTIPKVTFTVPPKDGYNLTQPTPQTKQITLSITLLYTSQNQTQNPLRYQPLPFSAPPSRSSLDHLNVKAKLNVYLNYTH